MALTLPSSPTNGQQVTYENTKFTFSSAKNVWMRETLASRIESDIVPTTNTSLDTAAISGSNLVFTKVDGTTSNVSLQSMASGSVSVYATESALPSSGVQAGDHAFVTATNDLYIRTATQWRNIDAVNLTPTISASISSHSFGTIGESIDITYTTNEPEGTPVTVTTSNTGITDTTQVDISHHTGNNTVTVVAGASELAGGILTISVTDGTNIGTAGITLDVVYGISFANHTQKVFVPADTEPTNTDSYGSFGLGGCVAISNNGLVVYAGARDYTNYGSNSQYYQSGAIFVYENTSGDTSNNTSWVSKGRITSNHVTPLAPGIRQHMGFEDRNIVTNSDGSLFAHQLNSGYSPHHTANQKYMIVGQRIPGSATNSGVSNYASFNSYEIVPSYYREGGFSTNPSASEFAEYIGVDETFTHMAYPIPSNPSFGLVFVRRVGTKATHGNNSWVFNEYFKKTDFANYQYYQGGIGREGVEMNSAGDKCVAANGDLYPGGNGGGGNGVVHTFVRVGTGSQANVWSIAGGYTHPYSSDALLYGSYGMETSDGGTRFGESISMTKDGQYLAVAEPGYHPTQSLVNGKFKSTARINLYQWNSGTSKWDLHSTVDNMPDLFGDDNGGSRAGYQYDGTNKSTVRLSQDFTMVYYYTPRKSIAPHNSATGATMAGETRIFKRDGTTWTHDATIQGSAWNTAANGTDVNGNNGNTHDHFQPAISGDGKTLVLGSHSYRHNMGSGGAYQAGQVGIIHGS
tara:strand:+ start:5430 stop:7667 length:2238 start_codon:yes stop_codon:yes gene_type:complete